MKTKISVLVLLFIAISTIGIYFLINSSKPISQQTVESIVKSQPEVKNLLNSGDSFVKAEKRGNDWVVQVASVQSYGKDKNIPPHSTTFNWYKLDQRGKILCSMFIYDNQGKFIGSGETEKSCI